jgi:putative photosynthetic complex assembly protein 2
MGPRMGALAISVPYVLFVWWFSTGTVLFLVGLSSRHAALLKTGAVVLFATSLVGVAASSRVTSEAGAYCVFTCAILLWGAVEISLLAGWITGPRPQACPRGVAFADRIWFALQAIAYHEFALIITAGLVFAVSAGMPNQLGCWTFAALLVLRQSAKINLFLGVRTLNDELMPTQVDFLRSYFARKPMNALFPLSVTCATAAAVFLAAGAVAAESRFEALTYSLLAALVALGALEHWFMVLPLPVVDLWRWSVRGPPVRIAPAAEPAGKPVLSVISGGAGTTKRLLPAESPALLARQRLEDQFRQAYRERQPVAATHFSSDIAGVAVQQTSIENTRMTDGRAP